MAQLENPEHVLLVLCFTFTGVNSNGTSTGSDSSSNALSPTTKALITFGIAIGAFLISLIVSKLVDYCYDKQTIQDDSSDISEHTRNLIRARMSVLQLKKNVQTKKNNSRSIFQKWLHGARHKEQQRRDEESRAQHVAVPSIASVIQGEIPTQSSEADKDKTKVNKIFPSAINQTLSSLHVLNRSSTVGITGINSTLSALPQEKGSHARSNGAMKLLPSKDSPRGGIKSVHFEDEVPKAEVHKALPTKSSKK
ncbi:hypothetical protein CHS0354_042944 [Potamilus streckersoni]|uniref:Transmembrane protein n=1 Tax=Potamilus streckersoni TaxID=2493646 RepID=A0AAE0W838_9BIVA|nr:hypothetical protein CHS0354_042944 [Potamilus streckersoni]